MFFMDRVAFYRKTIRRILQETAAYVPEETSVRTEVILDDDLGHFEIIQVGWDGPRRVHGSLMHVDIRDGKVWIEHNGTDFDIVREIVEAGISKDQIVLGFYSPEQRKLTEFAVI
jgi:ketopantoate reductase